MRALHHILDVLYTQPWAIVPAKHRALQKVIEAHLDRKAVFDLDEFTEGTTSEVERFQLVGNTAIVPVAGVILNKCSGLEAKCGAFSLETFKQTLRELAE